MKIQFKTADNAIWYADTETLQWALIDGDARDEATQSLDMGDLTNLNYGRFALAPRTEKSEAPGAALCNFSVMPLIHGTKMIIAFSANVPTRDFFMVEPVNEIVYEIISAKVPDAPNMAGADLVHGSHEDAPEPVEAVHNVDVSQADWCDVCDAPQMVMPDGEHICKDADNFEPPTVGNEVI